MITRKFLPASAAVLAIAASIPAVYAVGFTNFNEFGTTVNGFQDDFNGTTLNPGWTEFDGGNDDAAPLFTLSGTGTLLMTPANGDPNKLFYTGASYNANSQEILALIRVSFDGANADGVRGGISANSNSSTGQGFNLHFRQPGQNGPGNHFNLLNDQIAWGPNTTGPSDWTTGGYKWLRLQTVQNGATTDIRGKLWDAGTTPEPAAFSLIWNQSNTDRSGLAGLVTDSNGGGSTFEVDYVLLKTADLPSINVVPEPASLAFLAAGGLGLLGARRRRCRA